MLTAFGVNGAHRHDGHVRAREKDERFILAFALGCLLSSAYGFLAGTWPFGVVEAIWSGIALRRYRQITRRVPASH